MLAVALAERSLLRKWSPEGGVQRFQAERNAAECGCGFAAPIQAAEKAGCSWRSERCCANGALQGGVQRFQAERYADRGGWFL